MKASIIIPTYNRADVIIQSLETWTKQTLPISEFEVIVVDNNSKDNTAQLINTYIPDYKNFIYLLESNAGATYARHAGAKIAKGDILIFCDDDGLFNENCIESILNVYALNTQVAAVAGKIEIQWDLVAPDWIAPYEFMLGKLDYGNDILFDKNLFLNGGLFSIRKSVFEELGGFNPDLIGNYLVGDGDTGLVIKLHNADKLIGWTPFAVMKHLQFVNKQGTIQDLGRRFFNTGISNSYSFFRKNNFNFKVDVLKYIICSFVFYIKKFVEYKMVHINQKNVFFSMMQKKGELDFFLNLRKKEIRSEISKQSVLH